MNKLQHLNLSNTFLRSNTLDERIVLHYALVKIELSFAGIDGIRLADGRVRILEGVVKTSEEEKKVAALRAVVDKCEDEYLKRKNEISLALLQQMINDSGNVIDLENKRREKKLKENIKNLSSE